jgi:Mg-chelatase subunit ChlD
MMHPAVRLSIALVIPLLVYRKAGAQDPAPVGTVAVTTKTEVVEMVLPIGKGDSASPFDDDSIKAVVKGESRLTKRVILVIDVSGSMKSENRIGRAMQVVKHVMGQPVDDLEVAVITFSSNMERWVGVPEPETDPPVPYGWARLPSATALASAQTWVATRDSAGTEPNSALEAAIKEARDEVSVVFITDGDFAGESCVKAFREAQKARKDAGRCEAPVLVYGVGTGVAKRDHLATIGKEGGVGFYVDKDPVASSVVPLQQRR